MTSYNQHRILSPLLEGSEGEEETRAPTLQDFLPKEYLVSTQEPQICPDNLNSRLNGSPSPAADGLLELDGENVSEDEEEYLSDGSLFVTSNTSDFDTDLDINTEELLKQKKPDHDTTGKTKYIQVCSDMGIRPVSYFVKNLEQKELKLRFHGLDHNSVKAISIPLQTNTNIEKLSLQGNGIDATGAKCLCRVLRENPFLTEVVLAENKIGTEGAISLCQFLQHNRNLLKVDLTSNEIGDQAGSILYDVFKENKTLKELCLSNNKLEETSALKLKSGIQENDTLEILDLSWNHFKTRGAVAICEGLEENVGLKKFRFQMAGLDKMGAEVMARVLKKNRSLIEVDIRYNRIGVEGATHLAAGLKDNEVLHTLKVGNNPFDSDGALIILEAVNSNESSAIKHLDFSNILVKKEFTYIEERLRDERNLTIKSEGVLPDLHPKDGTFARLSAFRRDPINTFRKYAEYAGVKLEEVFNGGHRLRLDSDEFKTLIMDAGIDIPKQHLSVLCRTLDEGGFINYWKILDNSSVPEERSDSVVSFGSDISLISEKSTKSSKNSKDEKRPRSEKRTKAKTKEKKTKK